MKKYKKVAYVFLAIIIICLGFVLYRSYGKNNEKGDIKSKSLAEINRLENSFFNMFNEINNISFENYKIKTSEINNKQSSNTSSENNQVSNSTSSSSSSGSGGESSGKGGSGGSENNNQSSGEADNKKFELEETGILTKSSDIDWDDLKNEVETLYPSITGLTLDLYQINVKQEDIAKFNNEYDNLIKSIKDENKEDTLNELSKLYNYLPKFIENATDDETEKIIINTKNNIFKAYSVLDKEEWDIISNNVNTANQEFTKLLTSTSASNKNQYIINKTYVIINELQNSVKLKDKEIFLIKYKNLLEEIENI